MPRTCAGVFRRCAGSDSLRYPKTIVIERNAYASGKHHFNRLLLDAAKHYGFAIKLCAPYRAQTKGKVERFHCYLRESFYAPLQTAHVELVDVATANREVRICLDETASVRVHATFKERPAVRFATEQKALCDLPLPYAGRFRMFESRSAYLVPPPVESLQHPIAIYDALARELAV